MITQQEHQARRQRLFDQMEPNTVAVFPAAPEYPLTLDHAVAFSQDNDFLYLTGFPETQAVAVLVKDDEGCRYVLFNRIKDKEAEIWVGDRVGQEGACSHYLADEAHPIAELTEKLPHYLKDKSALYYTLGRYEGFDQTIRQALNDVRTRVRGGVKVPVQIINVESMVFEMRLVKSDAELAILRKAAEISAAAHVRVMKACQAGKNEYELAAELVYEFLRHGCQGEAYGSIVGGGKNACVLHYEKNDSVLNDGEMLLVDAGARYHHYCADITRTFPINGKFSSEQRDLYQVVLNAQLKSIEAIKAGQPWNVMSDAAALAITEGLVDLKILKGCPKTLFEQQAYAPYYMHRIGHWLGMDVHDVGYYKVDGQWRNLQAGMMTTIEPGLYFRQGDDSVHKRWWNMGVRIEDDILITDKGYDVFSHGAPKTVEEIEAIMQG
ncbi:MAG: Xaa-Pro aminopeptidase [Gammaproteobacteria bacterium CG11_big_fil_rev_8_21_14_0_20_46_22]|nr:MAG: Xaa-Pro aminopeptidase [Gammaproteobacteria bacterium CG12_big_fil_rev_8_21_14_0_65_46_12]PIR11507.1 MAG: Xaa-Pro aminopeptidase [Gammaproteobacteria bacterium CG11_big_fil_rev_8_21_14_0_20_46_22]